VKEQHWVQTYSESAVSEVRAIQPECECLQATVLRTEAAKQVIVDGKDIGILKAKMSGLLMNCSGVEVVHLGCDEFSRCTNENFTGLSPDEVLSLMDGQP
jgi:hypothetical protein